MPRTRADLGRQDKITEILDAAKTRLLDGGYESLSVVALARDLEIAQNAIYWYFPTKDHLFVAAVDRILHDILSRKPRAGSAADRVIWFADQLSDFQGLRVTMHDRARASTVVADYERDVVAVLRLLLTGALSDQVDDEDLADIVDAVMALCEGVLLREFGTAKRRNLIRFGLARLIAPLT